MPDNPKVALIHDWLVEFGGAEQVLAGLLELWPSAPLYTLAHDPAGPCESLAAGRELHTSFIQNLPGAPRKYRRYLPLFPLAVEQFDLRNAQLIISNSYSVAHGVLPGPDQLHINIIQSPVRYAWRLYHEYLEQANLTRGMRAQFVRLVMHYLRLWDLAASQRVDYFVANSNWTANNVWRAYRRSADVIYPPVDVEAFTPGPQKENFYLAVSRLVPYKRVDLMLDAFRAMPDKKLVVIGGGPDLQKLKAAAPNNVEMLGFQPFETLRESMQRARALIFAAEEDFGITPVEAQACGTPVIAYSRGGALETVLEGKTGLFFHEPDPGSLTQAVERFESLENGFDVQVLRQNAERFSRPRFLAELEVYVSRHWEAHVQNGRSRPGKEGNS